MNRKEHLLTILAEECSEVQKDTCKGMRFGLDDAAPGSVLSNRVKIAQELNDLFAVAQMLVEEGIIDDFMSRDNIAAKKSKVEYYLTYSKNAGTLD